MKCPKCGSDKTSKVSVLAPEWKPGEHWCYARWAKPDADKGFLAPPGELQCRRCAGGGDGEHRCLKK